MSKHHPAPAQNGAAFAFHGGRLDAAARRFPDAPRPWIDLSTGINPIPWPIERMPAPDSAALPSPDALAGLCAAAARCFGAEQGGITPVPGSEIGLRLLAQLDLPRPWRIVAPTYRTHHAALPGAAPIAAERLQDEAARGGTILLANPNNPDGRTLPPAALMAIAATLASRCGMLVVDEAFADVGEGISVLPLLGEGDRVIVSRSFGKFFGLAGIRLGFLCGHAGSVAAIAAMLGSWPVSAQAIACGTAAYADAGWIAATRRRLHADASALDRLLHAHGWAVRGGCPLFRLATGSDAEALFGRLARAGILTRPFDDAADWLRLGLPGDAAAFARLDRALRDR